MITASFTIPKGHKMGSCGENVAVFSHGDISGDGYHQTYLLATNGKALAVLPVDSNSLVASPIAIPPRSVNANGKHGRFWGSNTVSKPERKMLTSSIPLPEHPWEHPPSHSPDRACKYCRSRGDVWTRVNATESGQIIAVAYYCKRCGIITLSNWEES